MKHPQIVIFETDGLLARHLEPLAALRRWLVRESRQAPACVNLLRAGGPSVLVLKIGRNLVRELTNLDEFHEQAPEVPIIVVGDAADAPLQALLYELGATYVLFPPEQRQHLDAVVTSALESACARYQPMSPSTPMVDLDA